MKIAEYIETVPSDMVSGSAAISKEYMVKMADEHFYHFMGRTVGICMAVSTRICGRSFVRRLTTSSRGDPCEF